MFTTLFTITGSIIFSLQSTMSSNVISDIHRKGSIRPNLDQSNLPALDPTLASCCAREIESNRKATQIDSVLQRYDRVAAAERAKKLERFTLDFSFGKGCRCCYDPNSDGGEYEALQRLREEQGVDHNDIIQAPVESSVNENEDKDNFREMGSESSDDEFDYLLDEPLPGGDEDRRLQELEEAALYNASLDHHGFGVHRQMHPMRVLRAAAMRNSSGNFSPAVVHLFDANSRQCAQLDLILEGLGKKFRGTRFLRAEGRATILMDTVSSKHLKLQVEDDVPSLLAFMDGNLRVPPQPISSFGDRRNKGGYDENIIAEVVEQWLSYAGVLRSNAPPMHELCRLKPEEEVFLDLIANDDSESKEAFICGVPGCSKSFAHEHIGKETSHQSGRLVSDEDVLGNK